MPSVSSCESLQSKQQFVRLEAGFLLQEERAGCLMRDALEFDHIAWAQLSDRCEVGGNHVGDHRIAMAFAVAALRANGETEIKGADAAVISFPEFFGVLDGLAKR